MDCGEWLLCGEPSSERRAKDWGTSTASIHEGRGCGEGGTVILKLNT